MKLFSFAAGLAILTAEALAMFDTVEQLKSDNWEDKVKNDKDNAWMVTFYADWCPYCKTFDAEYANAAKDTRLKDKNIRFGAVDVMANRDLTKQFGIKRSPTVKVFGRDKSAPEDYLGQRKQSDVLDYVDSYTTKHNFLYDREAEEARIKAEEKARAEAAAKAKDSYRVDPYADEYLDPIRDPHHDRHPDDFYHRGEHGLEDHF